MAIPRRTVDIEGWDAEPIEVLCVRLVLDARAAPCLTRHAAGVAASAAKGQLGVALREATSSLRHVYDAWLAAGIGTRRARSPTAAHSHLDRWRHRAPDLDEGLATVATLLVASGAPLVTLSPVDDRDAVRAPLEALGNATSADVQVVDLVADGRRVRWPAIVSALPDPPLAVLRSPYAEQRFCDACGLPVAARVERCVECGVPLET